MQLGIGSILACSALTVFEPGTHDIRMTQQESTTHGVGIGTRTCLLGRQSLSLVNRSVPMATTAHQEMKDFWKKNQELGRPSSPWVIYRPHLPMLTSLTHRMTGIAMGVALYGISIGLFVAPGDFPSYMEFVKSLQLSPIILFPFKTVMAFPLVYHYMNGIRHLTWDAGRGFKLATQYKTGWSIVGGSAFIAALLASMSYW
ncbi:hypothetical protein LSH36_616g00009 [Paralvinella palmiformis]|uniref:Succinate dehydrogenase cytochrome b560 subunit, mitochondrial n=1 Tax=Paralvinella palmiformis TaxID=53620 RepID=A0AAD9J556_9ANNE|nr:hypothetical protein LSH36_616g00009 [Paralvinella palmiformis]